VVKKSALASSTSFWPTSALLSHSRASRCRIVAGEFGADAADRAAADDGQADRLSWWLHVGVLEMAGVSIQSARFG